LKIYLRITESIDIFLVSPLLPDLCENDSDSEYEGCVYSSSVMILL